MTPTEIGPSSFVTAGACATATSHPLVSTAGIDSVKLSSIKIMNLVTVWPNNYTANLVLALSSMKAVAEPSDISMSIPASVETTTAGAGAAFKSCSTTSAAAVGTLYEKHCGGNNKAISILVESGGTGCVPTACPPGDFDLGASGCHSLGTGKYAGAWSCDRTCSLRGAPAGHQTYKRYCGFSFNGNIPPYMICNPAPCFAGHTNLARSSCEILAGGDPNSHGHCFRICQTP